MITILSHPIKRALTRQIKYGWQGGSISLRKEGIFRSRWLLN